MGSAGRRQRYGLAALRFAKKRGMRPAMPLADAAWSAVLCGFRTSFSVGSNAQVTISRGSCSQQTREGGCWQARPAPRCTPQPSYQPRCCTQASGRPGRTAAHQPGPQQEQDQHEEGQLRLAPHLRPHFLRQEWPAGRSSSEAFVRAACSASHPCNTTGGVVAPASGTLGGSSHAQRAQQPTHLAPCGVLNPQLTRQLKSPRIHSGTFASSCCRMEASM